MLTKYYLFTLLNDEALVDVLLSDFCLILDLRLDNPLILVDPASVWEFGFVFSPETVLLLVSCAELREEFIEEIKDAGWDGENDLPRTFCVFSCN